MSIDLVRRNIAKALLAAVGGGAMAATPTAAQISMGTGITGRGAGGGGGGGSGGGTTVTIGTVTIITGGGSTGSKEMLATTLDEATHLAPLSATPQPSLIRTLGYYAAGDGGGATYKLVNAQPEHALWFTASDGSLWEYANKRTGLGTSTTSGASAPLSVLQAGVKNDGIWDQTVVTNTPYSGTDNAQKIQDALDAHTYFNIGDHVYFPAGYYRIGKTIHCGYGAPGLRKTTVKGPGLSYVFFDNQATILADFIDAPAVNFQGQRETLWDGVNIMGKLMHYIDDNLLGFGSGYAVINDSVLSNWYNTNLKYADGTSFTAQRYTPYAGICIDGWYATGSGGNPTYPAITYPTFSGISGTQNSKTASSIFSVRNCAIQGFEVGYAVHPTRAGSDGNGDYHDLYRCTFRNNIYHISVAAQQCRSVMRNNCIYQHSYACFVNKVHGIQQGMFHGIDLNGNAAGNVNVFIIQALDALTGGPFVLQNWYQEGAWKLGEYSGAGAGAGGETPLIIENSRISFDAHDQLSLKGIPDVILSCAADTIGQVVIKNSRFNGAHILTMQGISTWEDNNVYFPRPQTVGFLPGNTGTSITPPGLLNAYRYAITNQYAWFAANALAGNLLLAGGSGDNMGMTNAGRTVDFRTKSFRKFSVDANASGATGRDQPFGARELGDRKSGPSFYSKKAVPNLKPYLEGFWIPNQTNSLLLTQLGTPTYSNDATGRYLLLTFTIPAQVNWQYMYKGPLSGDVLYDDTSFCVFLVYNVNQGTNTVTCVQQNSFRTSISAGVWTTATVTGPNFAAANILFIGNTRLYTPGEPLWGDFTSGSADITNIRTSSGAAVANLSTYVTNGDYLYLDPDDTSYAMPMAQSGTSVSNISSTASLTLGATSSLSMSRVPLKWFIRPGAANMSDPITA